MKLSFLLCIAFALSCANAAWTADHEITGEASKQLAAGIKQTLIEKQALIVNPLVAKAIIDDLNQEDDSKRTLTSIDTISAGQLFSIFGLKDPGCDKNNDSQLSGDELKCLGKIWKSFVPK